MYKITIEKVTENPNYDEQFKKYASDFNIGYRHDTPSPAKEILLKSLVVDLTDEEFKAVKKAVLEVM